MPKALCMTGMVIAILILVLFLLDLTMPSAWAPFKRASAMMDIGFILCAVGLGYLSWTTFREQK
ncbi:MAG TPA: hypothetical protein PLV92_29110 [Pirellulaceae bacterium]|nr:hypothetical protein [Pirellulaceae bacterium]